MTSSSEFLKGPWYASLSDVAAAVNLTVNSIGQFLNLAWVYAAIHVSPLPTLPRTLSTMNGAKNLPTPLINM